MVKANNYYVSIQVVNFYLQMIAERSSNSGSLVNVYAFDTYFFGKVEKGGHSSVKSWTKTVSVFQTKTFTRASHMPARHIIPSYFIDRRFASDLTNTPVRWYVNRVSCSKCSLQFVIPLINSLSLLTLTSLTAHATGNMQTATCMYDSGGSHW